MGPRTLAFSPLELPGPGHGSAAACAAEKGVGGTRGPGIWHWARLVGAWRQATRTDQFTPSISPPGGPAITTLFFFFFFPTTSDTLCTPRVNGLEGEAGAGREPLLSYSSSSEDAHLNGVQRHDAPRGRPGPRRPGRLEQQALLLGGGGRVGKATVQLEWVIQSVRKREKK